MKPLLYSDYDKIRRLAAPLAYHLAIAGLLEGTVKSNLFCDQIDDPKLLVTQIQSRVYLSGEANSESIAQLQHWLPQQEFIKDHSEFLLNFSPPGWQEHLTHLFPGWKAYPGVREYYRMDAVEKDWRAGMPADYRIEPVTAKLLQNPHLAGLEALREEMCSERPSVDDFLEKSFGVCLFFGDELAGWCLSEYNTGASCEIGIATFEPHRRRGFAVRMTTAFMQMALDRGVTHLGWDCWQRNLPSSASARKAGFELAHTYPVGIFVREDQE